MDRINLMVLAPHEDDELAIAGPVIYQALQNDMSVKVVFSTNGDYYKHEGPIRIQEAIRALGVLGLKQEDIIFLGYGDQTQSIHLYNAKENEVISSHNGSCHTYGIEGVDEFAMQENGEHHTYTRANYKKDIKAVLKKYMPEIVITTDWDNHMDHVALSLMVDECLGELFEVEKEYKPLVLKAQAYTGKWEGNEDYHSTGNVTEHVNITNGTEWEHPLNKWEDRLRFLVPEACRTSLLRDNILYKAACEYKSQNVDLKAIQFINDDLIFWRRHTEGLLYHAKMRASSGNVAFLNDFKCVDCSDIAHDYRNYNQSVWITDETDNEKCVEIELETEATIKEMHFYENPAETCKIQNVSLTFDNNVKITTGELHHDGSKTVIKLPEMPPVRRISLVVDAWEGQQIGLTEIEAYDRILTIEEYQMPLPVWDQTKMITKTMSWRNELEKRYIGIVKYARGRLWPDRYFLMKRYDSLKVSDNILKVYWMYLRFVVEKVLEKVRRK